MNGWLANANLKYIKRYTKFEGSKVWILPVLSARAY